MSKKWEKKAITRPIVLRTYCAACDQYRLCSNRTGSFRCVNKETCGN